MEAAAPPLPFASCLLAGCHIASSPAAAASCPLDAPPTFQVPPPLVCLYLSSNSPLVCSLVVVLMPPLLVLSNPPACPPLPHHRCHPPSQCHSHCRHPQMHGAPFLQSAVSSCSPTCPPALPHLVHPNCLSPCFLPCTASCGA
jgi:hypothetical protein